GSQQRIELGYAGSRVLERLVQTPGEVVSREELLAHGWTDRVVSQGSLNQQIYVLRQILGDEKGRNIIQTLPRRGYLFNPAFRSGSQQRIELGYAGSRVLERLVQTPGEVVSREELLAHGWTDRVVSQGSLNQQIYVLRQILGDEKGRNIIQTLPRRGYLFNPAFLDLDAVHTEIIDETLTDQARSPRRRLPGWLKLGGLIALTPLLATCAAYL